MPEKIDAIVAAEACRNNPTVTGMIRIVIAIGLALHITLAAAWVVPERNPLSTSIAMADVVADVRVLEILPRPFTDHGRTDICGYDYVVEVIETLKGEHRPQRTFSIIGQPHSVFEHKVKPGERLLVLLEPRKQRDAPNGHSADVIRGKPSREELECRDRLGTSTPRDGERGGFLILNGSANAKSGNQSLWLAYARTATEMPKSLAAQQISTKRIAAKRSARVTVAA